MTEREIAMNSGLKILIQAVEVCVKRLRSIDMCKSIDSLILEMRRNPIMYIGDFSIKKFASFLRGYHLAIYDQNSNSKFYQKMRNFNMWLASYYSIKDALGWDDILLAVAGNDEDALSLFWVKWDEFCECQIQNSSSGGE